MISSYLQVLTDSQSSPSTLDDFACRINQEHQKCLKFPQLALIHGRNAGEELLRVQAQLSPQQWQVWFRKQFTFSEQTAQMYMQIAQKMPGVNSEVSNSDLATEQNLIEKPTELYFPPQSSELPPVNNQRNFSNIGSGKSKNEFLKPIISEPPISQIEEKLDAVEFTDHSEPVVQEESQPIISNQKETFSETYIHKTTKTKPSEINASATIIDVEFTPVKPPEPEVPTPKKTVPKNTIKLMIPGGVVPKARPRVTSNGTYLPPRYRAWRNHAEVEIYRQISEQNLTYKFPLRKAAISIRLIGNHRTNSDIDNLAGACLDALTLNGAGILIDDRLSCLPQLTVEYVPGGKETGVWIEIEPL